MEKKEGTKYSICEKMWKKGGKNSRLAATVSEINDGLLENKIFFKFFVIHNIMKADEVRNETRRFVSHVFCYVLLA